MRAKYEVADIFRLYGETYCRSHVLTNNQRKVMAALTVCRTAQLGGHTETCDSCGTVRNFYNSCRNRHCPKCQTMSKETWLARRKQELLPCGYFHMVFTVPHVLNPLILANRRELLGCLFGAVRNCLFTFAADPRWKLEGKPGLLTILHTWSQTMIDHFHIHCLIPAGVLSADGRRWTRSNEKFLFRVQSLAKEFKNQYLSMIVNRFNELHRDEDASQMLELAREQTWLVYAKKPFAGPEQVLDYLGRYTHRVAITNHRIKAIANGKVTFIYKDRQRDNATMKLTLSAEEFIRRFLLHVLPFKFMKIRYYGFLANCCKQKAVLLIRRLIGKAVKIWYVGKESTRDKVLRLTGRDILLCPYCRQGRMVYRGILPSANTS